MRYIPAIRRKLRFRNQLGITGLETAIVLIAFVVVSSVFAFAALSTGLFSADKSKEVGQGRRADQHHIHGEPDGHVRNPNLLHTHEYTGNFRFGDDNVGRHRWSGANAGC